MIKYIASATALKLFSSSAQTKRVYRQLGNTLGQRMRMRHGIDKWRIDRVKKILELIQRYRTIESGDTLLEIGTGWIHWESTVIRLFYDVEITLFDVWDNRQLNAYQRFFGLLEKVIDKELNLDPVRSERAHRLLEIIGRAGSFDEIYEALNFNYVLDPTGTLAHFQDQSFSLVISCSVLEHIYRESLPKLIKDFHRVLKREKYSIQMVDLGDHLAYYDKAVCNKNYLRYPDKTWKRFFENDVQYFNRVQRPEWLALFLEANFELIDEEIQRTNIGSLRIDKKYDKLERMDLECGVLTLVHQRRD